MNGSVYTADRTTHLKIVVLGLLVAIVIASIGIALGVSHAGHALLTTRSSAAYGLNAPSTTSGGILPIVR